MRTPAPGRLVVCDPCLDGIGSHPWACATALLGAACRRGWRGEIVARTHFHPPDGGHAGIAIHPVLRFPGASKLTATAELDRVEGRSRGGWRPPWEVPLRAARRRGRAAALAEDLRPIVGQRLPGDHFLVATASEIDALGLARAIARTRPPAGIGWHLCFHAPLLRWGTAPGDDARTRRVRRLLAAAIRTAAPHRLRFWATTPELAAEWRVAGDVPVGFLPTPILVAAPPSLATTTDRPLRITLLGDARPEKGFHLVGAILDRVGADPRLASRLRFAIQTNPGFDPRSRRAEDRAVTAALARVDVHRGGLADDLGGPLAPDRYRSEVADADAVLLPYDARRYHHRCSGVLLEALAAGKVPLVTAGGWMARQLVLAYRDHAAWLVERHPPLAERHVAAFDLPARGEARHGVGPAPAGADTLLVEATWTRPERPPAADTAPAYDTPLRLRLWPGCVPETVVLAADGDGRPTPAVVRVAPPPAGAEIGVDAPGIDGRLRVTSLSLRWLRCGEAPPLGAVGIVVPGPSVDATIAGLREFVVHHRHYVAGAAAHAATVARAHSPDSTLEKLTS